MNKLRVAIASLSSKISRKKKGAISRPGKRFYGSVRTGHIKRSTKRNFG